jgi:hypothetical protein
MKKFKIFLTLIAGSFMLMAISCRTAEKDNNIKPAAPEGTLSIGWAMADITPDRPVLIAGQFYARVSEGIMDPVTATVLALESKKGENSKKVLLISCDLVGISDGTMDHKENSLQTMVRSKLIKKIPLFNPEEIIISATHTHSAPYCSTEKNSNEIYGVELDAMAPIECIGYISERIADAAEKAWINRAPGGISYGLRQAVVGRWPDMD